MTSECAREQDVLDAIATNRWPSRCEEELRAHVTECTVCSDLAAVVGPLIDEHDEALKGIRLPPASVVWWRAQIRARHEAARAAAWPLTMAQAAAVATVLAVAGVFVMTGWARLDGWGTALLALFGNIRSIEIQVPAFVGQHALLLALALGSCLIIAPLVIYFAVSDE